jgi:putative adenylate-forming enzyme
LSLSASGLFHAARAFARTRWLARSLRTRADVERHRTRHLARMMRDAVPHIPAARGARAFEDLPIIDKAVLLADFAAYNRAGITLDAVRAALATDAPAVGGHAYGCSTGTSGNRGYFVISDAERYTWLGTILAKTLPEALWTRHRVALALPAVSSLYRSANAGSRVELSIFPLADGVDAWADRLAAEAPDTIVAPPKVLRALAERGQLTACNIFSGAEVLDPLDRAVIEAETGARVREIYMATEGLFGVACAHGTLHLAEDAVAFEWEAVAGSTLKIPVVTDFTRRAQLMARYRMNDLLELSDAPCACGSPLQPVARIEGRQDDVFLLASRDSGTRMVTPDVLRNAVVGSDARIDDFRIVQTGASRVEVGLPVAIELAPTAAALDALFTRLRLTRVEIVRRPIDAPYDRKLRRVRREWTPDQPRSATTNE